MSPRVTGRAHARAGLLGNPSDVYQGKAIAVSVANFSAEVAIEPDTRFCIARGPAEACEFESVSEAFARIREVGCDDGVRLLRAALARFALRFPELAALDPGDPRQRFRIRYHTDIPRQAGLSGSSAIVIAALRALADWFAWELSPFELSEMALAAEVDDLGITAGPMDRVIQAYEGALWMDFREPRSSGSYHRLDPSRLPPLFVAWDPRPGEVSSRVHSDVRLRWLRGDPEVQRAMAVFPALVEEGLACLERGDHAGFRRCMDRNFDTRASIWKLSDRDLELVAIGRRHGAAVKMCGSGGAVVGAVADAGELARVERAYRDGGYGIVRPRIEPEAK